MQPGHRISGVGVSRLSVICPEPDSQRALVAMREPILLHEYVAHPEAT